MTRARSSTRAQLNHNLPYQLTSFIGRGIELDELKRLLRERRLVTLIGTGGAGKTRLAFEAGARLAPDFRDGVFFVDLAPHSQAEVLAESVARAFGVEVAPDRPLLDALAQFLCGRRCLLLLDNCEHLLAECAPLARALLVACPDLCVLATSREPLGVAGECTFRIPLLSVPGPESVPSPDELMQFEAVQLFVDRAQLADPSFSLTQSNAEAVATICFRLDGLPLALELAAAALRALPVTQLAARLDERFRLLTAGDRTVLPRHQTLKALLDWSYTLLSAEEQEIFRRLAVFSGDWTLQAAEAVCAADIPPSDSVGVLVQLVNKSVVQPEPASGRYRMLETIRLYARGKLVEAGEQESTAERHFAWYLQFAEQAALQIGGPAQQQGLLELEKEHANLRAALSWAIGAERAEDAARLAFALWKFWLAGAYHREARRWFEQILALGEGTPQPALLRARLLGVLGSLADTLNEFGQSSRYHEEALSIWRSQGDAAGIARALHDLGWQHFQAMDVRCARQYAEESLVFARRAGDPATVGAALNLFVIASVEGGWLDGLLPVAEESLRTWRLLGNLPEVASATGALARLEQKLGNLAQAADLMLEGLRLHLSLGDYGGLIECLVLMVCFEFDIDTPPAGPGQRQSYQPFGYLYGGRLLRGPAEATRVLGVMAAWQDKVVGAPPIQWTTMVVPLCDKLRADMGESSFEREFAAGRAMGPDEILAVGEDVARAVQARASLAEAGALAAPAAARTPARTTPPASSPGARRLSGLSGLTAREVEVLQLVAAGLSNREAAERLVVTPRTINAHLTSIYGKTGVTGRTGAVRYAVEHGLV